MDKIIGIGNALVDVLVRLESDATLAELGLPRGGMVLIGDERQQQLSARIGAMQPALATGGSAGNAVLALARLGAAPGFIGRVGEDDMGRFYLSNCRASGIDARIVAGPGRSGVANTFISPDAERTFATYLGVAGQLRAADVTPERLRGYGLLHIEGYLVQDHDLIRHTCRLAHELGMRVSIDLASYNVVQDHLTVLRELVERYVDVVFANEEESLAFTGLQPEEALREIARLADVAVVKLGRHGALAMRGGEVARVPGSRQSVVDTTAAGDFFAGGFLYGLTRGASLSRCLGLGALLAGHVIQVVGTSLSDSRWQTIRQEAQTLLESPR